uniref:Thioredoxin domain-containing protein n=1 Tax=viral metagenome TaxID=1070528 RepID=A0A6C0H6Q6_9ZZZZ
MSLLQRPVLVFSEYCQHSINFINVLRKHPNLFNQFALLNIDINPQTRQRPREFYAVQEQLNYQISEVPTIVINKGEYVLTGEHAFKWLEYEINKLQKTELSAFNQNEMGSFSDSYAKFGSTGLNDATEQTFKFIHQQEEKIYTPQEDSVLTSDEYNQKQKERDSFSKNINSQPTYGKMPSDTFASANNSFNNQPVSTNIHQQRIPQNLSSKQKDIESRLQQLMMQREEFMPAVPKGQMVDFKTGRMN